MKVNYPKLKFGKKSILNLLAIVCSVIAFQKILGGPIVVSILLSILLGLFFIVIRIICRRVRYRRFIKLIGVPVNRKCFYENDEHLMSLVPFESVYISCMAKVIDSNLMFGNGNTFRKIKIDDIESSEMLECLGHEVTKVTLPKKCDGGVSFFIPRCLELEGRLKQQE